MFLGSQMQGGGECCRMTEGMWAGCWMWTELAISTISPFLLQISIPSQTTFCGISGVQGEGGRGRKVPVCHCIIHSGLNPGIVIKMLQYCRLHLFVSWYILFSMEFCTCIDDWQEHQKINKSASYVNGIVWRDNFVKALLGRMEVNSAKYPSGLI